MIHYGSNGAAECGAEDFPSTDLTLTAADVTCPTCRGWLPIVAPELWRAKETMKIKGFKLGATGQYPRGQADATDEGELRMALAADHVNAMVRIEFGKPIAWLGLPVKEAREFGALLIKKADEVERRKA